jgi:formylmethanofuran dehydrogenase subunit B
VVDFVCTGCGLMCDDLQLTVAGGSVVAAAPRCPLAESVLHHAASDRPAACRVGGAAADPQAGVEQAAKLLSSARAVLVTGLERTTVESQRLAVAIADRLGGLVIGADDAGRRRSFAPLATVGAVGATWGEVFERCDLAVMWRCDAGLIQPRLMERMRRSPEVIRLEPLQELTSKGASERGRAQFAPRTPQIEPDPARRTAAIATLRGVVRGVSLGDDDVRQATGRPLEHWQHLAERMLSAQYATIFYDATADDREVELITELAMDLHGRGRRATTMRLAGGGNLTGAAQVLAWQAGFPDAVSFARGFPEQLPTSTTAAEIVAAGRVDAVLAIGGAAGLGDLDFSKSLIGVVAIDDRPTRLFEQAAVALGAARFATETSGTVFRGDGVAMPLRAATAGPLPAMEDVLQQLDEELGSASRATRLG